VLLKWGVLIKENILEKVSEEVFAVRCFYNGYENENRRTTVNMFYVY